MTSRLFPIYFLNGTVKLLEKSCGQSFTHTSLFVFITFTDFTIGIEWKGLKSCLAGSWDLFIELHAIAGR